MDDKYPEIFRDLQDKFAEVLESEIAPVEENHFNFREISFKLVDVIRRDWGGQQPYLSKGLAFELERRDYEMYEKFTGDNYEELAKLYALTTRQVRNRINLIREIEFARKQPSLF